MDRTKILLDLASRKFSFGFAPSCTGTFSVPNLDVEVEPYLQNVCEETSNMATVSEVSPSGMSSSSIVADFPALFSFTLGTANYTPYEIELSDPSPVRSSPYRCAPPKLEIFRKMVDDLLERGVVRPSKSPYASPAFLVPKSCGGFRMVDDYRKMNSKVIFYSYPMPTIEQAFEQFGARWCFPSYTLIPHIIKSPFLLSRRVTAFCTPFDLFEFNKLPMGISVGCQGLSRVIDELFADIKGKCF